MDPEDDDFEDQDGLVCAVCGFRLPRDQFPLIRGGRYRSHRCLQCERAYKRRWAVEHYSAETTAKRRRWAQEHPRPRTERDKQRQAEWAQRNRLRLNLATRAKHAVDKAIRIGQLVRPASCEECGRGGVPIQAAHRDYARPLDVRWLCARCHSVWDTAEPKTLKAGALDALNAKGSANRAKTHCPQGHPYEGTNLKIARDGARLCRQCARDRARAAIARRKAS
jgi:ribosomal protein S27AE